MISELIGRIFSWWREALARALIKAGVRPNLLTILGMLFTVGAGAALAAGRAYWLPATATMLFMAGACDLLDGAIAKLGDLRSRFGAVLDSTLDRLGDAALYIGLALYFMFRPGETGEDARMNVTLVALALAGLVWAYLISYIKARAENEGAQGGGGFWQRPERILTILLGAAFGHVQTAVWILGIWPLTTVAHRIWHARRTCAAVDAAGGGEAAAVAPQGPLALVLWRWGRGTLPFDLHAGAVILMVVLWDIPLVDPLRDLAAWWVKT
jgi:CDP-diacylglycerol--glycerol-3-phosphate 3-phosphatidyltransferase